MTKREDTWILKLLALVMLAFTPFLLSAGIDQLGAIAARLWPL